MVFHGIMNTPRMDESLIPHQLHMPLEKVKKIVKGLPVNIPLMHMGSGVGEHIVLLRPQNARKLLSAYKRGKGMKLMMHPHELHQTIHHGRGFFDSAKKLYHSAGETLSKALSNPAINKVAQQAVHYGADALGTAVGAYFGNPEAGHMVGEMLGSAGEDAIKSKSVDIGAKKLYGDASGQAKEIAFDAIHNKIHDLPKEMQPIAKEALQASFNISHAKKERTKKTNTTGGKLKKGSAEAKAFMASIRSKKSGGKIHWKDLGNKIVGGLKTGAHYAIPAITGTLGGIAGAELGPVGSMAGSATGSYLGNQLNKAIGVGLRKRGRPRKIGGDLATVSAPFRNALRLNYGGVSLNNSAQLQTPPASKYGTNPNVRPSPPQMTLSPYQGIHSPAMNPFVPTTYAQMGGTSAGYGGRGLEFGHSRHMAQPMTGVGLYGGGGLYGANHGGGLY
jgi:hypothetical protein